MNNKRKLCITGGTSSYKKYWNPYIYFQRNALMDITISIIDICYANTARYLKLWWFLYFINEKLNKKCESWKIDQKAGEKCTPYRYRSLIGFAWHLSSWTSIRRLIHEVYVAMISFKVLYEFETPISMSLICTNNLYICIKYVSFYRSHKKKEFTKER